uniref:RpiB/LacA/LacB family sugar-phosphate isomerase n=1 Tax=Thermofilum pendens TaxID=2269 RepID=A0A7C3WLH5_THEPE
MRVAFGSDDNYSIANFVLQELRRRGFEVVLVGAPATGKPHPWPQVGYEVARLVAEGAVDMGVVMCYTGTGVSIAANKVPGIRAALCTDAKNARGARLWNDANVLALSARLLSEELAKEILDAWFETKEVDPSERENIEDLKRLDERLRCPESAAGTR